MATRMTYKRLDILTPAPTATGADLIQDNTKITDDVLAAIPDGGTAGQVLTKNSATNYDASWATPASGSATLSIGTVTTLAAGESATASITNNVLSLGIPKGATGSAGTNGTNGTNGTAATITVGTVTTLAAGASATVTNSGTTSAAVLNFGIPKGTDGSAGTGTSITVDSELSTTSTNPVQNNVLTTALNGKAASDHTHSSYATATHSHSTADVTGLATVATTGSYNDLTNKPTIPSAYTLPEATASELGGIKVGSGLSISNGVLSATGSGSGTGSNITECSESFEYYNGNSSTTHSYGSSPYPAELSHYAGYAMHAADAGYASQATYAQSASWAQNATYASYAYNLYGSSASVTATVSYASWAGPCYGNFDSLSTPNTTYASSKACLYETNASNVENSLTICPLPPLGPFVVDLGIAWTVNGSSYSAKYVLHGNNLEFTKYTKVSGDTWLGQDGVNCPQEYFTNFSISSSMLTVYRILSTYSNGCCVSYPATITATAIVTGRLGSNSGCCSSSS